MRLAVDMTKCQSYAQCCFLAPDVFTFEGEEALVYDAQPADDQRAKILQAAAACPVQAILLDRRDASSASAPARAAGAGPEPGVVVVGASLAGLRTAEGLRRQGYRGPLTLVGDEPDEPYDRPPLSKQVLAGTTPASGTSLPQVEELDATWRLGVAAVGLDVTARQVRLANGSAVAYDQLVIATGSRARPWPDETQAALDGVCTLRTAADAGRLRERLVAGPRRVLVIGAGFTGSEVASVCRDLGLPVTLVDRGAAPLAGALGEVVGSVVADLQREHGIDVRCSTTVAALEGDERGRLRRAHLSDGSTLDVDVAVVALGAARNVEWLDGSGLAAGPGGVACDATGRVLDTAGRTRDDVFVAGDVAKVPQALLGGRPEAAGHWGNAVTMAATVAETMMAARDGRAPTLRDSRPVPVFWSLQLGQVIKSVGIPSAADHVVLTQGSVGARSFLAVYGLNGRVVGAVALNQSKWLGHYERLVAEAATFPPPHPYVGQPLRRQVLPMRAPSPRAA